MVLIHSLSYLSWVGPTAYAKDFVQARQRICGLYRTGLSVLHGLRSFRMALTIRASQMTSQ